MTLFNPEITSIQADIQYHQEQIKEAEERLDQIKVAQAYSDTACGAIEDCIENIDPFYLPILRGHIESMFSQTNNELGKLKTTDPEAAPVIESPKEDTQKTRAKLLGIPDLTPPTYEDLAPNITYSSDSRAYVGFNNKDEAEEFRDAISEPSLLDDAVIMNGFQYEVKFHCSKQYIQEIADSVNSMSDESQTAEVVASSVNQGAATTSSVDEATDNFEEINPRVIYNQNDKTIYLGMTAKNRCDYYGQYLTGQLTVGEKYTYSDKPSFINGEEYKYELRITEINLEDAIHLASFNLQRDPEHPDNAKLLTDWRVNKVRELDLGKPRLKAIALEDVKLGDIITTDANAVKDKQYKVLAYKDLEGIPHVEAICIFNREMPALVNNCSWFKEVYPVDLMDVCIDPQFCDRKQEEILTENVNIYIPKPALGERDKSVLEEKGKPIEVPVIKLCAGDTVHRGIGDSQYEVIGTARKDNDLYAECRLISSSTRAASIGNVYYFKDGLYFLEEESVKAEPVGGSKTLVATPAV